LNFGKSGLAQEGIGTVRNGRRTPSLREGQWVGSAIGYAVEYREYGIRIPGDCRRTSCIVRLVCGNEILTSGLKALLRVTQLMQLIEHRAVQKIRPCGGNDG